MTEIKRIEIALLIMRITAAIFLGLWATLKFHHPEWQRNIFEGAYNISFFTVSDNLSYFLGTVQIIIVLAFVSGFMRKYSYGLMILMSAAGVLGSLGSFININEAGEIYAAYAKYPKNLMLTSIPTLGALVALFILRDMDNLFSLSNKRIKPSL